MLSDLATVGLTLANVVSSAGDSRARNDRKHSKSITTHEVFPKKLSYTGFMNVCPGQVKSRQIFPQAVRVVGHAFGLARNGK